MTVGILNFFPRPRPLLFEGKSKNVYGGSEPGTIVHYYKDETFTKNKTKSAVIAGKGVINNRISAHLMTRLEAIGVPTHFIRSVNMREQLVRELDMVPIEVVVRNVAAGDFAKRFNLKEGSPLPRPLVEFFMKNDELNDPWVTEDHIFAFGLSNPYELEEMMNLAWRVNDYLVGLMGGVGLRLVDLKLEFGRLWGDYENMYLMLADEISPDTMRLWDEKTGDKLDKDRFREDLGGVGEAYQTVADRLGLLPKGPIILDGGTVDEAAAEHLGKIENASVPTRQLRAVPKAPPPGGRRG